MALGLLLGLARSSFRRKRTSSLEILTSKRGPRGFYKGKNCIPTGFHTRKGGYVVVPEKLPNYVVPDLTGFKILMYLHVFTSVDEVCGYGVVAFCRRGLYRWLTLLALVGRGRVWVCRKGTKGLAVAHQAGGAHSLMLRHYVNRQDTPYGEAIRFQLALVRVEVIPGHQGLINGSQSGSHQETDPETEICRRSHFSSITPWNPSVCRRNNLKSSVGWEMLFLSTSVLECGCYGAGSTFLGCVTTLFPSRGKRTWVPSFSDDRTPASLVATPVSQEGVTSFNVSWSRWNEKCSSCLKPVYLFEMHNCAEEPRGVLAPLSAFLGGG
nr:39S ribosomal protein L41-A, mitochondrial-like [Ipomoea batatas]